jgi:hypothetical protein
LILQEIPLLKGKADQTLNVTLAGVPYTIRVLWNVTYEYWSLSINELEGDPILTNVKMVQNYPLVGRYRKLVMNGDLYFLNRSGKTYRPTFDDVGNGTYGLFYYDAESTVELPKPLLPRT